MNESAAQRRALWIAALVVVVLAIVVPPPGERSESANLSSHVLGDGGGRGFHLVLEALGVTVSRWQRPLVELPRRSDAAVALLAPRVALEDPEVDWLMDYVADGGLVVYVPAGPEIDAFGEQLGLERRAWSGTVESWASPPDDLRGVLDELPDETSVYDDVLDVDQNTVDLVELLVADDTNAVAVARLRIGRGAVLVPTADADLLTNATLADHEPSALGAVRLVHAALQGRPLVFDEYHQGYQDGAGVVAALSDWALGTHAGWSALTLLALGVLALLAAGWRFGRALAPPPPPSRSSLEHVDALADAFVGSRASARPARLLVEGLRRRWRLVTMHDLERRLDALAARAPELSDDIATVRRALPSHAAPWTDRHGLDTLCAAIDRVADTAPRG